MLRYALALLIVGHAVSKPARADVGQVVESHILPGYTAFTLATDSLQEAAQENCLADAVRPAYQSAFDAWIGVQHLRLGPGETMGISIAFWPDTRGATPRTLARLITTKDPVIDGEYAQTSVAARGFFALEAMLYNDQFSDYDDGSYSCTLVRAISDDLAAQAHALEAAWYDGYARTLTTGGTAENAVYLSQDEAIRALYTQLITGLEFIADQRLGRPMGSFERPRPTRAEAWRSGRSRRNVVLSLEALRDLAQVLGREPIPETEKAFEAALRDANRVDDPGFQNVTNLNQRFQLEVLQQRVHEIQQALADEIGTPLGIAPGFNSLDGD